MDHQIEKTIFVAGHRGMVGSAIVRNLQSKGYVNIVTASRTELDLMNQAAVQDFFAHHPIDQVYLMSLYTSPASPAVSYGFHRMRHK